jgi:hypothetical protein
MKKMFKFWAVAAVAAMFTASCADDAPSGKPVVGDGTTGTITVGVKAETPTRSLLTDIPIITAFENAVKGFDVYIFDWTSGFLEASATSADGSPVTITGVPTAGTKRVVVLANCAGLTGVPSLATSGLSNYDELADASVQLTQQMFSDAVVSAATTGMLMTGENASAFTLTESTNTITIPVKRVLSKIELGSITFDNGINLTDLLKFNITDVSIQRAIGATTINSNSTAITPITDPAPVYYGGFVEDAAGDPSTVTTVAAPTLTNSGLDLQGFIGDLVDGLGLDIRLAGAPITGGILANLDNLLGGLLTGLDVTLGTAVTDTTNDVSGLLAKVINGFWYVLPNDASTGVSTLLTLKGSYDGTDYFYPIEINSPTSNTSSETDAGTYIKRNTRYVINIAFKNLIGTDDPDSPGKVLGMEVTVSPQAWEGPVTQNSTW